MKSISLFALSILLIGFLELSGAEYHVDKDYENSVKFISDAPFEDFEGTTSRIDGFVYWFGSEFNESIDLSQTKIHFEVELATLKTGIGMRDKDMREDYLETDQHPYAIYEAILDSVVKIGENKFRVGALGAFEMHGVKKRKEITAEVIFEDNGVNIISSFQVNLKDHDIEVPKLLFLRVNEIIEVELDYNMILIK